MHIVTVKHIKEAGVQHQETANELAAWVKIVESVTWASFLDVRNTFLDADSVDGYVVFNIRHNRYRLITIIHYARARNGKLTMGHVYIRSVLTHREYDNKSNWDKGVS